MTEYKNIVFLAGKVKNKEGQVVLLVQRDSGVYDEVPLVMDYTFDDGVRLEVVGSVIGRHDASGSLSNYVLATSVTPFYEGPDKNIVELFVRVSKIRSPREIGVEPKKELVDGVFKVLGASPEFVPFVAWGAQVEKMQRAALDKSAFCVTGRFQSRQFRKGDVVRTAYELSLSTNS